jgi:hypothetical protein
VRTRVRHHPIVPPPPLPGWIPITVPAAPKHFASSTQARAGVPNAPGPRPHVAVPGPGPSRTLRHSGSSKTTGVASVSVSVSASARPPLMGRKINTNTAFTNLALSRLPAPGKGSTAAGNKIELKASDRAVDIVSRRAKWETIAKNAPVNQSDYRGDHAHAAHPHAQKGRSTAMGNQPMRKTIPVVGMTPGKASAQRAAQRAARADAVREKEAMMRAVPKP